VPKVDRNTVLQRLAEAEEQVVLGAHNVVRQSEVVAQLERDGYDSSGAQALLIQLEEARALHVAERDRLRKEAQSQS
jgi:hypothetical protein